MANFSALLKAEITRLARKEVKAHSEPLRKAVAIQRRQIADLKREISELQRASRLAARRGSTLTNESASTQGSARFSSKGLKSLRTKLGLSANDFGKLIGASGQSIYNWEAGKAVPREAQREKLAALRGIGKREALRRLETL